MTGKTYTRATIANTLFWSLVLMLIWWFSH